MAGSQSSSRRAAVRWATVLKRAAGRDGSARRLPRDTASRVWVNDNDGDLVLDVKLSASPPRPRSEAIEHLRKAGWSIVEVVTPTLFVVEKS